MFIEVFGASAIPLRVKIEKFIDELYRKYNFVRTDVPIIEDYENIEVTLQRHEVYVLNEAIDAYQLWAEQDGEDKPREFLQTILDDIRYQFKVSDQMKIYRILKASKVEDHAGQVYFSTVPLQAFTTYKFLIVGT